MNIRKKLQNPFALIAQGFIVGAIIFHAITSPDTNAHRGVAAGSASAMPS